LEAVTTPDAELHARRAASFGAQAAAYADHRPDYPAKAIDWVLPQGAHRVLDLAAGTGKLTQSLLARGLQVTAVEPDPEMLAELAKRMPEAETLPGTAEDIPLPDASVDAVLVGQAFHWFDVPKALAEIGRVVTPGGVLGALWNYEDTRVGWVAQFEELVRAQTNRTWAPPNLMPDSHPLFEPFEREIFDHTFQRTAESLAATMSTQSHMLVATDEDRQATLDRIMAYLLDRPETRYGEFELPLRTQVLRARRR
jgi:ubiquinone/menaquinone biosynthesis C-methylase UbiE